MLPIVVPLTITLAPITGSPKLSTTVPVKVRPCCITITSRSNTGTANAALTEKADINKHKAEAFTIPFGDNSLDSFIIFLLLI